MLLQEQENKRENKMHFCLKLMQFITRLFSYVHLNKTILKKKHNNKTKEARPKCKPGIIILFFFFQKLWSYYFQLVIQLSWWQIPLHHNWFMNSSCQLFSPFPHYLHELRIFFFLSLRTNGNISRNTIKLCKSITGFRN